MSRTRANWFLDLPGVDETDPLVVVEDIGIAVDLRADPQTLHRRLAQTLKAEASLFHRGTTCPIKDDPQACCSACGVRHSEPADTMSALCAIGIEQEQLLTGIIAARHGP